MNKELEAWKPLRKPHHRYQVSNFGRIRCWNNKPRKIQINWDLTKRRGIVSATIRDLDQKWKNIHINIPRSVYRLYIWNIWKWLEVTHVDWNFLNNYYKNLILWDDIFVNHNPYKNWLNDFIPPIRISKISKKIRKKIIKEYVPYKNSGKKLSMKYKISQTQIRRILNINSKDETNP